MAWWRWWLHDALPCVWYGHDEVFGGDHSECLNCGLVTEEGGA